jgi:hypothetical protein
VSAYTVIPELSDVNLKANAHHVLFAGLARDGDHQCLPKDPCVPATIAFIDPGTGARIAQPASIR